MWQTCAEYRPEGNDQKVDEALLPPRCFQESDCPWSWVLLVSQGRHEDAQKQDWKKDNVEDDGINSKNDEDEAEGHDSEDGEEEVERQASRWKGKHNLRK